MSDPFVPDADAAEQRREAVPAVEDETWEPPTQPILEGSEGDVWEQSQPVVDDQDDDLR
ncbi:MAG TPA: hypothetical protein VKU91_05290 [Acidimicrobiales bacterium]|nr:hypothetical protein [Acidimicrobiales bacterium]